MNKKTFSNDPEIVKRVEELEEKYKDDEDALEMIEITKKDIAYIEQKFLKDGYKGPSPKQHLTALENHLHDWY